jgi:AraC family transcriptional regulator of arabinose operon
LTHVVPAPVTLASAPTYWRCEPTWSWEARPLADHLLWCVLDGVGSVALGERSSELHAGTCVVFAPGDAPVASHDPRRRLLIFGVHLESPGALAPPGRWQQVRDPGLVGTLARRCDAGFRRGDALGLRVAQLCVDHLLCLIWEAADASPRPVDPTLEELARAIAADPSRRWTIAELARSAAMSRAQFVRRFTAHTGLPPGRFVIQARMARAQELLAETDTPVTRIAATLEYSDVGYFSRQFRSWTGRSPTAARVASRRPGPS